MDNTTIPSLCNKRNTGFHSGCGYEYQRYVFLYACTKLQQGGYVTFEHVEDIEMGSLCNEAPHIIIQVKEKQHPIQLKEVLSEIETAWMYLCDSNKTTNFWYITTQPAKLEEPPLCASSPSKNGIEIWNNPINKEEFQVLIKFLSQSREPLKSFVMRERNTPNAIRDSLISHITFFCEQPYLDEFKKEIEISLANCINQNGYQCTHIPTLLAVLKVEIDALMDKVHKQQGKTYKLFYSEFQRLIQKNINIPGSYIETHMDASPPIDLGNNIFNNPLLITTQNLFKNEQKVVDAVKTLENIDSTEEYCEKLAVLLLELIQIRTHKTLNTHLKNINDVNQQEYSCFVFANQLIFDLQKGNMDRDAAKQQAIKLITQLQIFYDRSE